MAQLVRHTELWQEIERDSHNVHLSEVLLSAWPRLFVDRFNALDPATESFEVLRLTCSATRLYSFMTHSIAPLPKASCSPINIEPLMAAAYARACDETSCSLGTSSALSDYGSHKAGYCVNAGLESLLQWMQSALPRRRRRVSARPAQRNRAARVRG
jgi:hypothetical protein